MVFFCFTKMFFVVFVECINKPFVIPTKWIRDPEITIEKFINYSINRNQKHFIYYNSSEEAVENLDNFCPNFGLPIANELRNECCYIAKLIKYYRKSIFEYFPFKKK